MASKHFKPVMQAALAVAFAYALHFPGRFVENMFMGWLQGRLAEREKVLMPLSEQVVSITISWLAPFLVAFAIVWGAFSWLDERKRIQEAKYAGGRRASLKTRGMAIHNVADDIKRISYDLESGHEGIGTGETRQLRAIRFIEPPGPTIKANECPRDFYLRNGMIDKLRRRLLDDAPPIRITVHQLSDRAIIEVEGLG